MLKSRGFIIFASIISCISIVHLLCTLLIRSTYIYEKFSFDISSFLLEIALIIVFNLLAFAIFIVFRKARHVERIIFTSILLFLLTYFWVVFSGIFVGEFWKSETDEYDYFTEVDDDIESKVKIGGARLSDICCNGVLSAKEFYYSYQSTPFWDIFELSGYFVYTDEAYAELKSKFSSALEWEENNSLQEITDVGDFDGAFVFNADISLFQSETNVDSWERCKVFFNDESKMFFIDFSFAW